MGGGETLSYWTPENRYTPTRNYYENNSLGIILRNVLRNLSLSLSLSRSRSRSRPHSLSPSWPRVPLICSLAHGANRTGIFIKNRFVGAVEFPWLVLCVLFRYFPDFCVLDNSECGCLYLGHLNILKSGYDAGISKMFVFWALKMLKFPRYLPFGAPKHTGFSRMSGFLS